MDNYKLKKMEEQLKTLNQNLDLNSVKSNRKISEDNYDIAIMSKKCKNEKIYIKKLKI
jgi:hypothetical protein